MNETARLAYGPEDAAAMLGITRSRLFQLIAAGALRSYKDGRRRLVSHAALVEYQKRREDASTEGRAA